MKKLIVLFVVFCLANTLFSSVMLVKNERNYPLFENIDLNESQLTEIITTREKNDIVKKDIWKGVKLFTLLELHKKVEFDAIEFYAGDNYFISLKKADITPENSPIIAIRRNETNLNEDKYRLIGNDIPEMYWISDIIKIKLTQSYKVEEPSIIYPYHTIVSRLRLYSAPEPFVDIKAYKIWDIVSKFAGSSNTKVRIVSKDGLEQILDFSPYLRDSYLAVKDNKFSVYAPNMPTGMWQKDILLIQVGSNMVFFYDELDIKSKAYQDFVSLSSKQERKQNTNNGFRKVIDWETLKWKDIIFIQ